MNQINYPKLLQSIKNVQLQIPEIRPDKALKDIKSLDIRGFDDLIRECHNFQESVERAAEDCQAAVESPIYIGVVGHYSHGKSSLLNALLFPPRSKEILPTGEGVVTSLCTLLQFSNLADDHEFYEVEQGGDERYLPADEYQARVSGRGGNAGSASYFKVRLQVDRLGDPLFRAFADKQIELLDTPGLGGPYWKDEQSLISWIKEFVMIVVCIKSSEINETTAETINPFLRRTTKPIVPVITFWDLWRDSSDFNGITDELKARAEAKQRLKQFFPTLDQYADEATFTSSKSCINAVEVPEDSNLFFTEEWNVDNVRRSLENHVQAKGQILRTQKTTESTLDSQRRNQVRQLAEKLCAESSRYTQNLRSQIQNSLPKGEQDEVIQLFKDDFERELERETDRIATQIDRQFEKAIPLIGKSKDWGPECAKLKQDIELSYRDQKKQSVTRLMKWFERFRQIQIAPLVKASSLKNEERKRLDTELNRYVDDFKRQSGEQFSPPEIVTIPNVTINKAKNLGQGIIKGFKQLILTNAPLAIGLLVAIPIIVSLSWVLKFIPGVNILVPIVITAYLITLLGVFWSQFQNAIEKSLYEAREKTLQTNSRDQITHRIETDFKDSTLNFLTQSSQSIENRLAPLDDATRNVFEILSEDLEKLEDSIREVRQLI